MYCETANETASESRLVVSGRTELVKTHRFRSPFPNFPNLHIEDRPLQLYPLKGPSKKMSMSRPQNARWLRTRQTNRRTILKQGRSRRSESKGQRVIFERYYASLLIVECKVGLGIAGLEPATIRLKAQCSTN